MDQHSPLGPGERHPAQVVTESLDAARQALTALELISRLASQAGAKAREEGVLIDPKAVEQARDALKALSSTIPAIGGSYGTEVTSHAFVRYFQDQIATKIEGFAAQDLRAAHDAAVQDLPTKMAVLHGQSRGLERAALWVRGADIAADDYGLSDD